MAPKRIAPLGAAPRSVILEHAEVPVAEIRALYAKVERTHDAYWIKDYAHASIESRLRRNAWVSAVHRYEDALAAHAPALLDCYEHHHGAGRPHLKRRSK